MHNKDAYLFWLFRLLYDNYDGSRDDNAEWSYRMT